MSFSVCGLFACTGSVSVTYLVLHLTDCLYRMYLVEYGLWWCIYRVVENYM
jgi:hypothetical protein